ncbi:MAG: hypothetical protein KC636_26745, partial [Myxococcales bacterium]|nr:hypothetical protein [Myxococcales bacterium]
AADVTIPSAQKAIGAGAPTPGPVPRLVADPSAGLAYLTWHARVVRVETPLFVFDPGPPASREPAELELRRQLDPGTGAPEDSVRGRLSSFSLGVPGLVDVGFSQLTFSHDSTGAGLDAAIDAVTFRGPLGLFDRLAGELGIGGSIEAGVEDGIAYVRARRSVPTLAVGVFELSNLELIAAYYLPLDERTSWLELAASSPARPFRVAVCGVGGDGHLALEVGAGGLQRFELGLGAAGGFALDVGVASGNVRMSIGVSYEWSASEGNTVSGSITLGGAVEVLGVVSVSITMTMGLAWEPKRGAPDRGSLHGRAQLDVKISILFFSAAVTLTVERRLAGADPPFTAQVSRDEWLAYAEAFA